MTDHREVERLLAVMDVLREQCPWDRQQTHASLVPYLVEEACETVEAIESGSATDLREELGDLLLQVVFHARIASEVAEESERFDIDDVARGIADKLVARHPHVFAAEDAPADLHGVWEQRKAVEKGRSSALDGIPEQLSALSRATKIIHRVRSHRVPIELPDEPVDAGAFGGEIVSLVARAQAQGLDAEQLVRAAVRELEADVRVAEAQPLA